MKNSFLTILLCIVSILNAQSKKITLKDYNLRGKVERVIENIEKVGVVLPKGKQESSNNILVELNYNLSGLLIFNQQGNTMMKENIPRQNFKSVFTYNNENKLLTEALFVANTKNKKIVPTAIINYVHKNDTIIYKRTDLRDKSEKSLVVTQVFSNGQLTEEYTEQKQLRYTYDDKGTLIKKEGLRKRNGKTESETYEIKYDEMGNIITEFCPETSIRKSYYPNGLLKTFEINNEIQEYVYTYDSTLNWITNSITINGKPHHKYTRKIDYFE